MSEYPQVQHVRVVQEHEKSRSGSHTCRIGSHISFDADKLQCYVPGPWEPVIYDTMLVAGAVEFCDISFKRPLGWRRAFKLSIPVHEPGRWNADELKAALRSCLERLTGDAWDISFRSLKHAVDSPAQGDFGFEADRRFKAAIPYSDGLDSRALAAIMHHNDPRPLLRIRVGEKNIRSHQVDDTKVPFENIPFSVVGLKANRESSARSRGFKFGLLSGLAAYLTGIDAIVVPESGQGSFGPMLVTVGQAHGDRRTHPEFTSLLSAFLRQIFEREIRFEHPLIWNTKGQSLAHARQLAPGDAIWKETRSCWKDARLASAGNSHRQCGICAACLLRRCSLHAAGYVEDPEMYVWEDLSLPDFASAAHPSFRANLASAKNDAIAATLHMDHIAESDRDYGKLSLQRQVLLAAEGLGISYENAYSSMTKLIAQHRSEWHDFKAAQGSASFLQSWAIAA